MALLDPPIKQWAMLTNPYVEAVLADPDQAYAIWLLWAAGDIDDAQAVQAWWSVALYTRLHF